MTALISIALSDQYHQQILPAILQALRNMQPEK